MFHEVLSLFTGWFEWRNWQNRIEVGLLFTAIYLFLLYLKDTRGERIIKALGLFLVVTLVGLVQVVRLFALPNIEFLLDALIGTLLISLVILFQPELRRGLIRLGSSNLLLGLGKELIEEDVAGRLVATAVRFSKIKLGALIVIERNTGLRNFVDSGTRVDALITPDLLSTIFFPGTALHDGAAIIRGSRIVAAGCTLPLTDAGLSQDLGMRHRAALGMSEDTDAVVLVVSEETGIISLAVDGELRRGLDREALLVALHAALGIEDKAGEEESVEGEEGT